MSDVRQFILDDMSVNVKDVEGRDLITGIQTDITDNIKPDITAIETNITDNITPNISQLQNTTLVSSIVDTINEADQESYSSTVDADTLFFGLIITQSGYAYNVLWPADTPLTGTYKIISGSCEVTISYSSTTRSLSVNKGSSSSGGWAYIREIAVKKGVTV